MKYILLIFFLFSFTQHLDVNKINQIDSSFHDIYLNSKVVKVRADKSYGVRLETKYKVTELNDKVNIYYYFKEDFICYKIEIVTTPKELNTIFNEFVIDAKEKKKTSVRKRKKIIKYKEKRLMVKQSNSMIIKITKY